MELYVNGVKAQVGIPVTLSRGEKAILTGWQEPWHSGSSGRVYIKEVETGRTAEYFPGVIGAEFE